MSTLLIVLYVTATAIVLALSRPALQKFARLTDYNQLPNTFYHDDDDDDDDGEAGHDFRQEKTSQITSKLVIFLATTHTILAILKPWIFLAQVQPSLVRDGLALLNGLALVTQALSMHAEADITARYRLGLRGAWSWLVTGLSCLMSIDEELSYDEISVAGWGFGVFSTLVILSGLGGNISFPRRPQTFRGRKPVDGQFTTSILSRITFSWARDVMPIVKGKGNKFVVDDLPEMANQARAETLLDSFRQARSTGVSLWWTLIRLHRGVLIQQMSLTVVVCFLSIVPSLALFEILQALETWTDGTPNTRLWMNVALLALGVLLSSTLDTWKVWFSFNCLSLQTFEQLSLAVFEKSMFLPTTGTFSGPDAAEQGTGHCLNLIAMDAKYVADCVCFSYVLYKAPLQLAISGIYLAHLLGWQSLVAGAMVLALMTPVNVHAARKYTLSQQSLMVARDRKMQVLSEVLQLIRQIKFSAQETRWEEIIGQSREEELHAQWSAFRWHISQLAVYLTTPVILSVVCLGTHALMYQTLSAPTAFSAIAVLNSIEIVMYALPDCVARTATGLNSMKRIRHHLESRENNSRTDSAAAVEFSNATLGWTGTLPGQAVDSILHGVTLCFPPSKLSLVTGPTGCGKSLLLASILEESTLLGGNIRGPRDGKYAYVAQVPWLENTSIRNNILFGNSLDISRYNDVLFACALHQDLTLFPDGDATEVGPNGVNLSGGQKWRLSLARALYSPANILVMDDIFSAVDVHTASHLYTHALTGLLAKERTRILVTHHISLCLPQTDYIVSLNNGSVQYAGPVVAGFGAGSKEVAETNKDGLCLEKDGQPDIAEMSGDQDVNAQAPDSSPSQFVEDEKRQEGSMQWTVWKAYFTMGGSVLPWTWVMITFGGYSILLTARTWWLHIWSNHESDHGTGVYVGLGAFACLIGTARSYLALKTSLFVAKSLFSGLLHTILHTPLRWLDVVPPGRIMNRFIVDNMVVDSLLGDDIQSTLANAFDMALAILAGSLVSPWLMLPATILCIICVIYGRLYLNTAREIRRLESVLKSSIFEQARSALSGLWTIRAEDKTAVYVSKVTEGIDKYARAYWQLWLLNCWLAFRMDVLGAVFAIVASILVVSSPSVNASLAGFAISFALKMAQSMSLTVRRYAGLELSMNSVERILEYSEVPTEPIHSGDNVPTLWPSHGCVQVSKLSVSYAADLPPALHDISFSINSAERIGVVGRTGSGKSSLILALFRFLEASEGSIVIDGLDISILNLQQLRARLAIVPQNPAVFSGTVRTNLDPFRQHSDDELLVALRDVQWDEDLFVSSTSPVKDDDLVSDNEFQSADDDANESSIPLIMMQHTTSAQHSTTAPSLLDYPIAADGENLSQGRRQLLCLARAILQRPKLLVLDEATSGIDQETDRKVQASIRRISKLNSMSLLVVAHRLSTVVDFDRILVLSGGRVAEFGNPQELMQRPAGVFRAMMMEHDGEQLKRQ
ncbi:ABC transporter family protein, partial [Penicillium mononematosum]|uniref:ABC transporter family protein n=1 Tax=Penicillium mononematosum TaxID=268346 RepID=UPI002547BBC6